MGPQGGDGLARGEANDANGPARDGAEAALIARTRNDRAAFGDLFRFYVPRVYSFCRAHSTTREEAEDLTAQTFERALATVGRYDEREKFSSWLFRIAANAAIDRARRGGRKTPLVDEDLGPDDAMSHAGAVRWVEQWEQSTWLKAHLAALSPEQQQVVKLLYYEDQSVADVATAIEKSEDAVKQLTQRALKALRDAMNEETTGDVR